MLNIGTQELLLILVLVFLLFGPRHLPEVSRRLGRGIGGFRRALDGVEDGFRRSVSELPDPPREEPPRRDPVEGGEETKP